MPLIQPLNWGLRCQLVPPQCLLSCKGTRRAGGSLNPISSPGKRGKMLVAAFCGPRSVLTMRQGDGLVLGPNQGEVCSHYRDQGHLQAIFFGHTSGYRLQIYVFLQGLGLLDDFSPRSTYPLELQKGRRFCLM